MHDFFNGVSEGCSKLSYVKPHQMKHYFHGLRKKMMNDENYNSFTQSRGKWRLFEVLKYFTRQSVENALLSCKPL